MESGEQLARVRALPDGELVSRLNGLLRASRHTVAEVIAHLGEVEERRLYLLAGHGSMFSYCVARLGMSEDEACRRIDVARLARRHPLLFERLADGGVSLSVAALLKMHLTGANAASLLDAVSGKTVWQAKEVLAAWFPQPDVLPSVRKLPPRKENAVVPGCTPVEAPAAQLGLSGVGGQVTSAPAVSTLPCPHKVGAPSGNLPSTGAASGSPASDVAEVACPTPGDGSRSAAPTARPTHRHATHRSIEPLSAARYKVQLTASAELKHKLELARDLLRHAIPSGDLAALIERALDVLLEQTMKRRFAMPARARSAASSAPRARATADEPLAAVEAGASKTQSSPITQMASAGPIAMSVGSALPAESLAGMAPLSTGGSPINGTEPTTRTETTIRTEPNTRTETNTRIETTRTEQAARTETNTRTETTMRIETTRTEQTARTETTARAAPATRTEPTTGSSATPTAALTTTSFEPPRSAEPRVTSAVQLMTSRTRITSTDGITQSPSRAASTISATTSVEPSMSAEPLSTSAEALTTMASPSASAEPTAETLLTATSAGRLAPAGPDTTDVAAATPHSPRCSRHLPSDVRRSVFVRDEGRCTWTSPDGVRCDSRAWLEHDHVIPRGMGGGNDPSNIRLRCRAHNQLAAEQAYGRDTIRRIVARRRRSHPPRHDGSEDATSP